MTMLRRRGLSSQDSRHRCRCPAPARFGSAWDCSRAFRPLFGSPIAGRSDDGGSRFLSGFVSSLPGLRPETNSAKSGPSRPVRRCKLDIRSSSPSRAPFALAVTRWTSTEPGFPRERSKLRSIAFGIAPSRSALCPGESPACSELHPGGDAASCASSSPLPDRGRRKRLRAKGHCWPADDAESLPVATQQAAF